MYTVINQINAEMLELDVRMEMLKGVYLDLQHYGYCGNDGRDRNFYSMECLYAKQFLEATLDYWQQQNYQPSPWCNETKGE